MGVLVVLCMGLFIALAMLMVLIARVMMQGLALAAPLAAVLGVLPTHTSVLARLWDLFTASVVAVAKFVVAGGVMALVLGAIQANSGLGAGAKLFWVVVATVVGIVLTRPVRSFKTIVPGLDPNKSYLKAALSGAAAYVGARTGAGEGTQAGLRGSFDQTPTDQPAQETVSSSPDARESLEPLPKPAWSSSAAPDPVWTQTSSNSDGARVPSIGSGGLTPPRTSTITGEWAGGQTWPGVVGGGPSRRELPAAPLRLEAAPAPAVSGVVDEGPMVGSASAGVGGAAMVGAVGPRMEVLGGDTVVDAPKPGGAVGLTVVGGAGPAVVDPTVTNRPRLVPSDGSESRVVYPSGVIVAAEEHPLYRRTGDQGSETSEVYVALPELELADDGTEHEMVAYYSSTGTAHGTT